MANEQNLTFDIVAYNKSLTPEQRRENARTAILKRRGLSVTPLVRSQRNNTILASSTNRLSL